MNRTLGLLMRLPWHVNVLIGEFIFVAGKWLWPAICSPDGQFRLVSLTQPDLAWLFSAIFLLFGAFKLAAQNRRRLLHWRQSAIFLPGRQ